MPLNELKPNKGRILVSEPSIGENFFNRSVVIIAEHNQEGTVGFILNKAVDLTVAEAVTDLETIDLPLYLGGPVSRDNLFYMHTLGEQIEGSREIMKGLYWGGDFNTLKQMILEGTVTESQIKFFIGYAGWEPGQLEKEIEENSWVVAPTLKEEVMDADIDDLWKKVLRGMGQDLALLSFFPENPNLNLCN
jgi:putative transcriptional regulator